MTRLADGDRAAFRPAFDTLWPLFRRFAGRMLGDCADAEDAAQQALCRVFERASEYDPARDALPWLLAIVANECRTVRRRRVRRREDDGETVADALVAGDRSPEEAAVAHDLSAALLDTFGSLSPIDRATLEVALGIDDVARSEVAPATFRKRLERALDRLRVAFRGKHGSF